MSALYHERKIEKLNSHLNFGWNFFLIHFVDETQFPNSNPLPFHFSSFIFILAFAAKDILGFYDNFFRILIERKEIKINVFTFHSLKCQKTKNSNPELYKYVHSKYNTNFNSKAVDLPWGFMKFFFVFGNLEIDSTFVLEDYQCCLSLESVNAFHATFCFCYGFHGGLNCRSIWVSLIWKRIQLLFTCSCLDNNFAEVNGSMTNFYDL